MINLDKFTITVDVEDITRTLILREYVGEGSYGDYKLELAAAYPTMSPIVEIDDSIFIVNMHDIAKAVAEHVTTCWAREREGEG